MSAEEELETALLDAYERAKTELHVYSPRFKPMLRRNGARETAKRLLKPRRGPAHDGFRKLIDAGRPDLTLESIVLQARFRSMFTRPELGEARKRLGLAHLAGEINLAALGRPIGTLQKRRSERHRLTVVPSLFDGRTIWERYAFHVGGLSELQFNIGLEEIGGEDAFRHGVAFSLQPTRNMPDIRVLIPRIERFNEFLTTYSDAFADLTMWHWTKDGRSENYPPCVIPGELIKRDCFIFMGALQPAGDIDIDWILDDFDRLMPLYEYVEGEAGSFPRLAPRGKQFTWSPGNNARAVRASYRRVELEVDKDLRHNVLQDALFKHLVREYGEGNVSGEQDCGNGTPVDVAVRDGERYTYFEIKTGVSAQSCIRQALGQLMEYSYWPGAQEAETLVIVGEAELDADGKRYLKLLRERFQLPLEYRRFDLASKRMY